MLVVKTMFMSLLSTLENSLYVEYLIENVLFMVFREPYNITKDYR